MNRDPIARARAEYRDAAITRILTGAPGPTGDPIDHQPPPWTTPDDLEYAVDADLAADRYDEQRNP